MTTLSRHATCYLARFAWAVLTIGTALAATPAWAQGGAFVRYVDPSEQAFSIDVPAGWRVSGGSRRMSTVEIRSGVQAVSPDGAIRPFYGDLGIPIFTVPTPMLAAGGLRAGMVHSPGYGQHFIIMPYHNGMAFAVDWGGSRVGRDCGGVTRAGAQARPDLSRGIDMAYAAVGVRTSIVAGEARFSCTLRGGQPAIGYVLAATELVRTQASSLWDVKSVVGFVASTPRAGEANALLGRMVSSFAINPAWAARQQQTAMQTSRIVAQTNQIVSNAIIQNGRTLAATSDMIVQGGRARSEATSNAVANYDEKAVRGTSTYVNPTTGDTYTRDNSVAHQYVNPGKQTLGTDSETAPGPGWTELQRVPAGH